MVGAMVLLVASVIYLMWRVYKKEKYFSRDWTAEFREEHFTSNGESYFKYRNPDALPAASEIDELAAASRNGSGSNRGVHQDLKNNSYESSYMSEQSTRNTKKLFISESQ